MDAIGRVPGGAVVHRLQRDGTVLDDPLRFACNYGIELRSAVTMGKEMSTGQYDEDAETVAI